MKSFNCALKLAYENNYKDIVELLLEYNSRWLTAADVNRKEWVYDNYKLSR